MTEYQLSLIAEHRPEVLERLLRVIRHRGFTVTGMHMQLENQQVRLKFSVKSDRSLALLINQLVKLPNVVIVDGGN